MVFSRDMAINFWAATLKFRNKIMKAVSWVPKPAIVIGNNPTIDTKEEIKIKIK